MGDWRARFLKGVFNKKIKAREDFEEAYRLSMEVLSKEQADYIRQRFEHGKSYATIAETSKWGELGIKKVIEETLSKIRYSEQSIALLYGMDAYRAHMLIKEGKQELDFASMTVELQRVIDSVRKRENVQSLILIAEEVQKLIDSEKINPAILNFSTEEYIKTGMNLLYDDGATSDADKPIDILKLSSRSLNALKRAGYFKISEVQNMNHKELSEIKSLGKSSIAEIEMALLAFRE